MARGVLPDKQVDILAKALNDGMTQLKACELAGLSVENASHICNGKKVLQRRAELQAQQELREAAKDAGTEEPLTKRQYLAFIKSKMNDPHLKDEVVAKYVDMYGRGIGAFTEKLEIDQNVSYAEVLAKRKNKKN